MHLLYIAANCFNASLQKKRDNFINSGTDASAVNKKLREISDKRENISTDHDRNVRKSFPVLFQCLYHSVSPFGENLAIKNSLLLSKWIFDLLPTTMTLSSLSRIIALELRLS